MDVWRTFNKNMTNTEDCPENSNDINPGESEQLSRQERINHHARLIGNWKANKQPKYEAENAARLHIYNRKKLREAGGIIDGHRAGEGREQYNAKRRNEYAEAKGGIVREYQGGLSDEARKERHRVKNLEAQARFRAKKSTAEQSAERAARRHRAKEREAEAVELAEIARMHDADGIS